MHQTVELATGRHQGAFGLVGLDRRGSVQPWPRCGPADSSKGGRRWHLIQLNQYRHGPGILLELSQGGTMKSLLPWLAFIAAALLEVAGDAVVRKGLRGRGLAVVFLGCVLLGCY